MATVSTAYPAQLGNRSAQRNPNDPALVGTENNNGGTIVTGGSIANTAFTAKTPVSLNATSDLIGSQVFQSAEAGHIKANNSRNYGLVVAGEYIIPKVTTTLGGLASSALATNGNRVTRSLHFNVQDNWQNQSVTGWDYVSGQFPTIPTAAVALYPQKDGTTTTAGTVDKVTLETPAAPGRLTFMTGSKTANSQAYAARYNG